MMELWRKALVPLVPLTCLLGCTGQTLTGLWQGPFPLEDAKECRTRLYSNGRFDLTCRNDRWLGRGEWRSDGKTLIFDFESLAENKGRPIKRKVSLGYVGKGNAMDTDLGEWRRGSSNWTR